MAAKKTLKAENLESLGAKRLAALLMEISEGDAAIKRRLRLELAGTEGPAGVAKEVRKRLATIGRARSFVDWQDQRALLRDLQTQRTAIVGQVAKDAPAEAFELMWQFLDLARSVYQRTDDSNGIFGDLFRGAVKDLGELAAAARPDPKQLADRVFRAMIQNDYGQYDELIPVLAPVLGPTGLDDLKRRMTALAAEPVPKPKERKVIGWGFPSGPIYQDDIDRTARESTVRLALQDIADAQGDVDAYIAQYDEKARRAPAIAAQIARRLLTAGRAAEAWKAIEAASNPRTGWPDLGWEDARIEVLEALGRSDEAQASRWSCFERSLSARHLRDYLKRLPDFEDFEAEQRALDYAEKYPSVLAALSFLVAWPALDRAARVVVARAGELDGDHYEILTPAAEALAGKHPLAATLLLRAMIDFALTRGRSSRYGHAARHLRDCAGLAASIPDFSPFETHDAYVQRLRREHGRKSGFWSAVPNGASG